jgi:short-subunit dehydrogenase
MELIGTRVVVTGASRGIGAMLATKLADKGARVALVARSRDAIGELAAQLGGDAYPADLADVSTIEPLVRAIETDGRSMSSSTTRVSTLPARSWTSNPNASASSSA